MAGKFIKGALVAFTETFLLPVPNVIVFQFNPETMTHTWNQPAPDLDVAQGEQSNPLAVKGYPGESFSFTLVMDASETIASSSPAVAAIAAASGVYSRLAALEMLLYPVSSPGGGLIGTVSASISAGGISAKISAGSQGQTVPRGQLPTVLFVWGPGRILPVRVTSLVITEKLYDTNLNPTHVEAQLGLQVLTPDVWKKVPGSLSTIANAAYTYSQGLRQALALANLANAADSILGMIPP